jgi:phosphatidylglycerol:prolipoprotein diacylglycerol transferase
LRLVLSTVRDYHPPAINAILTQVHPVLFHIGSLIIPSYGAMAAVGVLVAIFMAQRTARMAGVDAAKLWNLCVISLCAALVAERLVLIVANWSAIRSHPEWTLALAMVHHPLMAAVGVLAGGGAATFYVQIRKLPPYATADALAAPLTLGLACEQVGALLAGSGYGTESTTPLAVTYSSPAAALWSGTPLGVPLHPVQAYAALAYLTLGTLLLVWLPARRREGDIAGLCLMGMGAAIYLTELWRAPEGRGALLNGALDGPQIAAALMVLLGAWILRERSATPRPEPESSQPSENFNEQHKVSGHEITRADKTLNAIWAFASEGSFFIKRFFRGRPAR